MNNVCAYIRTATTNSESSVERQRAGIEQLLKHRAFTVVDRRGPAISDIVDEIESGDMKPGMIVVWDVTRITRNFPNATRLFAVLREHGGELHTVVLEEARRTCG